MMDITPLQFHCAQEGLAARARLTDRGELNWKGTTQLKTHNISHLRYWEMLAKKHRLKLKDSDRISTARWNPAFVTNKDSFTGATKHRALTQYNVFTDGSRHNEQTGCGFIIYKNNNKQSQESARLPDYATVFQAEVTAVHRAAMALCRPGASRPKFVKFFIDSQAAIRALGNPIIKSKTVADAVDALAKLSRIATRVTLCWIPAHKGHFGNTQLTTSPKTVHDQLLTQSTFAHTDPRPPLEQTSGTVYTQCGRSTGNQGKKHNTQDTSTGLPAHTKPRSCMDSPAWSWAGLSV